MTQLIENKTPALVLIAKNNGFFDAHAARPASRASRVSDRSLLPRRHPFPLLTFGFRMSKLACIRHPHSDSGHTAPLGNPHGRQIFLGGRMKRIALLVLCCSFL